MKKLIALIAVVALTASCFASSITITATTTASDTIQIGYSGATGGVPIGVSMKVAVTSGDAVVSAATDITEGSKTNHKVYIDYAKTNGTAGMDTYGVKSGAHPAASATAAGVATFPATTFALCMGELQNTPGTSGVLAVIKFTGTSTSVVHISADTASRGGIVDDAGAAMTVTWPTDITLNFGGGVCLGDVDGSNYVDFDDFDALVILMNENDWYIDGGDAAYVEAADMDSSGYLDFDDFDALVILMNENGWYLDCPY